MATFIRSCMLLDLIGVLHEMAQTSRGMNELHQSMMLGGPAALDFIACDLYTRSQTLVAMVDDKNPGRALSVAGFIATGPKVLRTWMFTPDATWDGHSLELTQHTAAGIQGQLKWANRIETYCLDSHEQAKRWYARIGLHKEATLTKYCTDGSDAALFVVTRGQT